MFKEKIIDGIGKPGGQPVLQQVPQQGAQQAVIMDQQITQLQEQTNRLSGIYQRQLWES